MGSEFQASLLCYSLPLPRSQFDPGPDIARFVVHKVALEQLFPLSSWVFLCQYYSTTAPYSLHLNPSFIRRTSGRSLETFTQIDAVALSSALYTNSEFSVTSASSPPNAYPCLLSLFTRRTSAYCLEPFDMQSTTLSPAYTSSSSSSSCCSSSSSFSSGCARFSLVPTQLRAAHFLKASKFSSHRTRRPITARIH